MLTITEKVEALHTIRLILEYMQLDAINCAGVS